LSISHASKKILLNLVRKNELSVDQIVRDDKRSMTLHGKFESKEAIIKIYKANVLMNQIEILEKTKEPSYRAFSGRSIILHQEGNVFVIEELKNSKTLEEMLKENPSKVEEYCEEVLSLIHSSCYSYCYFWSSELLPKIKVIFYENSWKCINFKTPPNYTAPKCLNILNFVLLFETFRKHGLKLEKLWEIFQNTFKFHNCPYVLCKHGNEIEQKYFIEHKREPKDYFQIK
jgi:hypothetical protein